MLNIYSSSIYLKYCVRLALSCHTQLEMAIYYFQWASKCFGCCGVWYHQMLLLKQSKSVSFFPLGFPFCLPPGGSGAEAMQQGWGGREQERLDLSRGKRRKT